MPWTNLGTFNLTNHWVYSSPVEGEIFRITHHSIEEYPEEGLRAVIAQGFHDAGLNVFKPKRFVYSNEIEVFNFYFPQGLEEHFLAFKRLDKSNTEWIITVELFHSDNPEDDLNNYLISRFGETAMSALYPRLNSGGLKPKSGDTVLSANVPKKILDNNIARGSYTFRTTSSRVTLATGFDEDNEPLITLEVVPPNYTYSMSATTAGMYQGEVWALSEEQTNVGFTEFSAG